MRGIRADLIAATFYRAKQFFAALRPQVSVDDWRLVETTFSENRSALTLFQQMGVADQQHAIAVLRMLLRQGPLAEGDAGHLALRQAALLHDAGKAMGQPLIHRVVIVLLKKTWPEGLRRLAQTPLTCAAWRRPFVINAQHPQIGALWAQEAGCDELTVTLIRLHQQKPLKHPQALPEKLHKVLYEADGEN